MAEEKALNQLQSEQGGLLNKIDELRTIGVGGIVELPQLIVCGCQSSGKSSVLEAITRVRFPAKSNVCTRFATEVVLRRSPSTNIKISIEPGPSRSDERELEKLRNFRPEKFVNGSDLPALIEKAKECMGIDDSAEHTGFSSDVLRVEISGPDKPELTLVDLPGLYSSTSQDQKEEGITIVRELTKKYMSNSRSIILAVISAKMDYHLQEILDLAKQFDPDRERTLAIITQPDTLEERSEEEDSYLQFVQNKKVFLKLGWHAIRNRSFKTRDDSHEDRDKMEKDFFEKGRWASISRNCVGIDSLRHRLSNILLSQIRRQLPELIVEIKEKVTERQQELSKLGATRSTIQEQKRFLLGISGKFERITSEALNGLYTDPFFGDLDSTGMHTPAPSRLRAVIRYYNELFADAMWIGGCHLKIIDQGQQAMTESDRENAKSNPYLENWSLNCIDRYTLECRVASQARGNRGIELPGSANPQSVGRLFREQSEPWEKLARSHLLTAWDAVRHFISLILQHLTDEHTCCLILTIVIEPKLEQMKQSVLNKLDELTAHLKRGHPLPVGRGFLARVQKARSDRESSNLYEALVASGVRQDQNILFNSHSLRKISSNVQSSHDEFAASEIVDQMEAYYDAAIVTFVDNVVILGIENCLLDPLQQVFTGQTINDMDDLEVQTLAAEPTFVQNERERLSRELEKLQAGLRTLSLFGGRTQMSHLTPVAFVTGKNKTRPTASSGGWSPFQPPVNGKPAAAGFGKRRDEMGFDRNHVPVKSNESNHSSGIFPTVNGSPKSSSAGSLFSFNSGKPETPSEGASVFGDPLTIKSENVQSPILSPEL